MGAPPLSQNDALSGDDELERELTALRARAFSADADIQRDPVALARLAELEELHAAALARRVPAETGGGEVAGVDGDQAVAPTATERSARPANSEAPVVVPTFARTSAPTDEWREHSRRRWAADWRGLVAIGLGAAVGAAAVVAGFVAWAAPRPDATLTPTERSRNVAMLRLVVYAGDLEVDATTLQPFESFRGVDLWTAQSRLGNDCLIAVELTSNNLLGASCVPEPADPTVYIYDVPAFRADDWHDDLPSGTVVRFVHESDVVTAWLYEGSG